MARKVTHQSPTASGTLAHIRIHGELHRRHFKRGTDPLTIKQWLLAIEMKHRRPGTTRTGKFADDARAYLDTVRAMPTFSERERHIEEWVEVFGGKPRDQITPTLIRAQLQVWRTVPRSVTYTRTATTKAPKVGDVTLSASAVNKRRTALMHLWSVLDGKAAYNPVREVPKLAEPIPTARAIPYPIIRKMFAAMPPSKTKARLLVIAFTGIPHAQLQQITAGDVDMKRGTVAVAGRKKGSGTAARILPLTKDGIAAFKMMRREEAWGPFARSSLRRNFRVALKRVAPDLADTVTTYDLRHAFATEMYRRSGDIRATQILIDSSQVKRYTVGAVNPRVAAAIKAWK